METITKRYCFMCGTVLRLVRTAKTDHGNWTEIITEYRCNQCEVNCVITWDTMNQQSVMIMEVE